jgi:prepilin-type N-terminal cleavage/methylation domain-containing protein
MKSHKNLLKDENGFTLIEVISVLIILGVLSAVAVPKYVALEEDAKNRAIDAGIAELNSREKLMWARFLLADGGYTDDGTLFASMIAGGYYDLGEENYTWGSKTDPSDPIPIISKNPDVDGGALGFQNMKTSVRLQRLPSSREQSAIWIREPPP